MKIYNNCFVTQEGAFEENGALISGTQRIPFNHKMSYWQGANEKLNLVQSLSVSHDCTKDEAIYVGRIPIHFGHFIMEGLPRLCDIHNLDIPIIGFTTRGSLPIDKRVMPIDDVNFILRCLIEKRKFYKIEENETYFIKKLLVPTLPFYLSYSCSEPWRMAPMIRLVVEKCREKANVSIKEKVYLSRDDEDYYKDDYSSPYNHVSSQIALVSYADILGGKLGSNTHLSIFAKSNAITNWEINKNNSSEQMRNQAICDLVKTYNTFL